MPPFVDNPFENAPEPAPITPENLREVADGLASIGRTFTGDGITYLSTTVEQLRKTADRIEEERKPKPAKVYTRFVESSGETAVFVEKPDGTTAALYVYQEGAVLTKEFDAPPTLFSGGLVYGGK
ncbi:hypothetical protein A5630_25380 [Mycolicibacterium mucogenicum]|uniref:Uncharacterized protein n=1 Tax=Mycolicibacterium mucogenicum TaxID=56689 RepID=A0A1A3GY38_MYCMU|nr:hypothetical protein [Mycolicibacterium mucogenicum]OBJ40286.1 hypothetical protein A5630_25380 [Mycolicibacterium mucogenicum]